MLSVLLESNAVRQRRDGGAAMSVATHVAIVGLVAAITAQAPRRPVDKEPLTLVRIVPPSFSRPRPPAPTPTISRGGITFTSAPAMPVVVKVPTTLPPIDLGAPSDAALSDVVIGSAQRGIGRLGTPDLGGAENSGGGRDWTGAETLMRLVRSAKPLYPERMRALGISGRVSIRFAVDTTGRVDLSSVQVVESTHELFTRAVREVLPSLRFKPSEANGQRVRSLAEMPFEFQIAR